MFDHVFHTGLILKVSLVGMKPIAGRGRSGLGGRFRVGVIHPGGRVTRRRGHRYSG